MLFLYSLVLKDAHFNTVACEEMSIISKQLFISIQLPTITPNDSNIKVFLVLAWVSSRVPKGKAVKQHQTSKRNTNCLKFSPVTLLPGGCLPVFPFRLCFVYVDTIDY